MGEHMSRWEKKMAISRKIFIVGFGTSEKEKEEREKNFFKTSRDLHILQIELFQDLWREKKNTQFL